MAEEDRPDGSPGAAGGLVSAEKHIGRRAFLALLGAGIVALVFGRDIFSHLSSAPETGGFAINSIYTPEPIDLKSWRLSVVGLVQTPLEFSWKDGR